MLPWQEQLISSIHKILMYFLRKVIFTGLIFISWELNAQVALPTFQGAHYASSFSSHTFTNCGATGKNGPTLANCKSSYDVSWENDTDLFNVQTQGIQEWSVPADGDYRITAYGAQASSSSGKGAKIIGDFSLTQGMVLKIAVGQEGSGTAGKSGGGGSFVVKSPYNSNSSILIIAGGGGGGTSNSTYTSGQSGNSGGQSDHQTAVSSGGGGKNQGCIGGGGGFLTDGNVNGASNSSGAHGKSFLNGLTGGSGTSSVIGGFGGGGGIT